MGDAPKKFYNTVKRLAAKIEISQTPVPGFIMGLSGTDSIVAFMICYEALELTGRGDRMYGVHYVRQGDKQQGWFIREIIPFLQMVCPKARIEVAVPLGGNRDQQRWADLSLRSLNEVIWDEVTPLEPGKNYWVVNTINATEWELGSYSNSSRLASLSPIRSIWKSEVLEICSALEVPSIALEYARLPDCLCGRAELAASNIELIDDILRMRLDPTKHDPELLKQLFSFIAEEKKYNGFKQRGTFVV